MRSFPFAARRLLSNFGGTLRAMYEGLRAVDLCRPELERTQGDMRRKTVTKRDDFLDDMEDQCTVRGVCPPPLYPQVGHIVPFALGRTAVPLRLLFFAVVALLLPEHVQRVWDHAGWRHVNDKSNLLVLTPDLHSMMDDGELFLVPNMAGGPHCRGVQSLFLAFAGTLATRRRQER
jgi:hypothetical protein